MYGESVVESIRNGSLTGTVEVLDADGNVEDTCTLLEFADANEDDHLVAEVGALAVGATYQGGGGAAAEFAIRRAS